MHFKMTTAGNKFTYLSLDRRFSFFPFSFFGVRQLEICTLNHFEQTLLTLYLVNMASIHPCLRFPQLLRIGTAISSLQPYLTWVYVFYGIAGLPTLRHQASPALPSPYSARGEPPRSTSKQCVHSKSHRASLVTRTANRTLRG